MMICFRSCCFHLEVIIDVNIASTKSNDGYFPQRSSMLRFGTQPLTLEGRKAQKVAID